MDLPTWIFLFLAVLLRSCIAQNAAQGQNTTVISNQDIQKHIAAAGHNGTDDDKRKVLDLAVNHPFIQQIFRIPGGVDYQNLNGSSLLMVAASLGVVPSVKLLLAAGAFVNMRDKNGRTPLLYAARKNHSDIVKVLLEAGADPNIENWNYGDTALSWASSNGNIEIAQNLVAYGANINHVNKEGDSPLTLAVKNNYFEITKFLIERGAYVDAQNNEGWTSVMQASQNGRLDILRLLIQAGARLDARTTKNGDTALIWATSRGHNEVIRELLASGAQVDIVNLRGKTALGVSISRNRPEAANILLAYGSDINLRARDGNTVLMEAVNLGREAMVEVLLQHCPDMTVVNINRKNVTSLVRPKLKRSIGSMIEGHEKITCVSNGRTFPVRSIKYDSCREQKCCQGMWQNTGRALASCGEPCTTPGTASGTCVRVSECVRLDEVFTVTNAAQDVGRISRFLVDYRCAYQESNIHVCCPSA